MTKEKISQYIPSEGISLVGYKGVEVIDKIGEEIFKEVVSSILSGGNFRSLTEGLTRRRLSLSNAALFVTYLQSSHNIKNFVDRIPDLVKNELSTRLSKDKKLFLNWCIGLTGKSIQNVLRSDEEAFESYLNLFEEGLKESIEKCEADYDQLESIIKLNKLECEVNWPFILYLFAAIGAQTLAIRDSEKSMYGKLFEKLILGSLLTILGFELVEPTNTTKKNRIFWLTDRGKKRESDATLLYKPGVGVRFDIGFIGPGNTEISLDKVSRFEREMEFGRDIHYMSTIILVDRIGEGSRIVDMAKEIKGEIVQMSMTSWVKDVAQILQEKVDYTHPILKYSTHDSLEYIKDRMQEIELRKFIKPTAKVS